ncbi:hypothetical protein Pmani_024094 [Petrolisthes manimaculis]|uniref:C-type lectin domain-containing protein n=1 Tax=Petrolisthes manimaculis TaxID=1843537 RepID=A0AAE1U2L6_9EUCA|nr:hypothetical protein Pmani_024094 [Petrolisthes manimaculis]
MASCGSSYFTLLLVLILGTGCEMSCVDHFTYYNSDCVLVDPITFGTWSEMRAYCQSLHSEADLITFPTLDMFEYFVQYLNNHEWPNQVFWVGGTDEGHEGIWSYVDGSLMAMGAPYWALTNCDGINIQPDGNTQQNCAALDGDYYYYMTDKECEYQHGHPICYYD